MAGRIAKRVKKQQSVIVDEADESEDIENEEQDEADESEDIENEDEDEQHQERDDDELGDDDMLDSSSDDDEEPPARKIGNVKKRTLGQATNTDAKKEKKTASVPKKSDITVLGPKKKATPSEAVAVSKPKIADNVPKSSSSSKPEPITSTALIIPPPKKIWTGGRG